MGALPSTGGRFGGQMFPGDLEDSWPPVTTVNAAIAASRSPAETVTLMSSPDRHESDHQPGVEAARPTPVPAPVGFCSAT